MKRTNSKLISVKVEKAVLSIICILVLSLPAFADYEIRWHTIDGGGGTSSGGQYLVRGTIGQHDAAYSQGGEYELLGGFWPGQPLCFVDFEHFANFAQYWLQIGTGSPADLHVDLDNIVNVLDLKVFTDYWLCSCPLGWPLK